jgi:hypothetical protein
MTTDKLDAAVIRDWLARIDHDPIAVECFTKLARYALELSDKVESQAAEIERLRDILDKRRRYQ